MSRRLSFRSEEVLKMKRTKFGLGAIALLSIITGTVLWAAGQAPSVAEPQQKAMEETPSAPEPQKAIEQAPPATEPPQKAGTTVPPTDEPQKKATGQVPSTPEPQKKAMEQAPPADQPQKKTGTTSQSASPANATIQGQVLKIESDSLIVSTGGGGQARLKLDGNTKVEGSPKVGDKVEAELSPERNVLSLKVSQ
jgi:type IV secretory pathway VirB10-like protein